MASRDGRSSREGRSGKGEAPSLKDAAMGRLQGLGSWCGGHRALTAALVALVAAVVMLYGPARNYYGALRTGQDLQLKYEGLTAENSSLGGDLDRLQSKEGIEDEARSRGYVSAGETGVVVDGLPDKEEEDPSAVEKYQDNRVWYVKLLDLVFCYDPEATWNG